MKIALLSGFEESLTSALEADLAQRKGVEVIRLAIGATGLEATAPADVVLDRASHENAFYRAWIAQQSALGARIVNPPERTGQGCAFADLTRARRAGIATADTLLLPAKSYAAHIGASALRNLAFPLNWDRLMEDLGGSAQLLPATPVSAARALPVEDVRTLLHWYDQSGMMPLMLQRAGPGRAIRAWCTRGGEPVLCARDDEGLLDAEAAISSEERDAVLSAARRLNEALALDHCAADFSVSGAEAVLTMIDATASELEAGQIGEERFQQVVIQLAQCLTGRRRGAKRAPGRSGEAVA